MTFTRVAQATIHYNQSNPLDYGTVNINIQHYRSNLKISVTEKQLRVKITNANGYHLYIIGIKMNQRV